MRRGLGARRLSGHREQQAHAHALGDVVQGDRGDEQRGALPTRLDALGLISFQMQVRQERIEHHEEGHAEQEAAGGRDPTWLTEFLGLLDSGIEQRPHARRIMTPAAKPKKIRCVPRSLRKKNTVAAPAVVMSQVKPHPRAAQVRDCIRLASICIRFRLLFRTVFLIWSKYPNWASDMQPIRDKTPGFD